MSHRLWVLLLLLTSAVTGAVAQTKREARSDNRPILEQIRSTDSYLRLEQVSIPPLVVVGPPGQHLKMMTDGSDTVLIIRIEGKKPELTERRNWIRSVVSARVERVLKASSSLPVVEGSRVTFKESGGTMQVGSATVEAVVPWASPYRQGTRYLVFGVVADGELILGANASYEEGTNFGVAKRLMKWSNPSEFDEIESFGFDEAARRVKEHAELPRSVPSEKSK